MKGAIIWSEEGRIYEGDGGRRVCSIQREEGGERAIKGEVTIRILTTCSSSNIHEQYLDNTQHAMDLISGVGSERF